MEPSKNVEDRRGENKTIPTESDIASGISQNAPGGSIPTKPRGWGKASSGW